MVDAVDANGCCGSLATLSVEILLSKHAGNNVFIMAEAKSGWAWGRCWLRTEGAKVLIIGVSKDTVVKGTKPNVEGKRPARHFAQVRLTDGLGSLRLPPNRTLGSRERQPLGKNPSYCDAGCIASTVCQGKR